MFGPAPAGGAGTEREGDGRATLYLPAGRWVDLWRSVRYSRSRGGLELRRARTLRGRRTVRLPAPLDELPLLARAGTVLPLLSPDVDTPRRLRALRERCAAARPRWTDAVAGLPTRELVRSHRGARAPELGGRAASGVAAEPTRGAPAPL